MLHFVTSYMSKTRVVNKLSRVRCEKSARESRNSHHLITQRDNIHETCVDQHALQRIAILGIAILGRARKYLPIKYRLLLYNACIKPLFTYCCTVWSNCSQTNLDELFKLQKRCARLILDSPWDARSFDNFQKLKWLPIDQN